MIIKNILLFICLLPFWGIGGFMCTGQIILPKIFSDNMVLQREVSIPIWGWANPNETIELTFNQQHKKITADYTGKWKTELSPEKAGGPYEMTIKGISNQIIIKNILVGEVWLCSGQSNMEWSVEQSDGFEAEKSVADNPNIRQIKIEKTINSSPQRDISSGQWEVCNAKNFTDWTAVGYYFAKELYQKLKVPIGLINASWGGTNIETWISREGFENSPEFKDMIAKMPKFSLDSLQQAQLSVQTEKVENIQKVPINSFNENRFKTLDFQDNNLPTLIQPNIWESQSLGELDGIVWIRKTINLTQEQSQKPATLYLAMIDDEDTTYVNGVQVGTMNIWNKDRVYTLPKGLLKAGKNVIAIKITDTGGGGGIHGKPENVKLDLGNESIFLGGDWKFQVQDIKLAAGVNEFPSLAYNSMISPIIPYPIKGVIWYQGESNAGRAYQYNTAFPLLITDWRQKWNTEFPFYYVQLATFKTEGNSNEGSDWAELREAQTHTLQLPKTGMVVATDVGNPTDIHPTDKTTVGKRLSAIALNNDYGIKTPNKSPQFQSMEIKDNHAIITFSSVENGLIIKGNTLNGFEIADETYRFLPAQAVIKDNKVIVSNPEIKNPVAVRFGWKGDDSDCNLFNSVGLPAIPFRTDIEKTITKDKKYKIFE